MIDNSLITSCKIIDTVKPYEYMNHEDIIVANIPNGIKAIGERAFFKCKNLKNLTLPNTITTIENSAFSGCENLEEIILPNSVKTIGYRAFADCKRLKKIIIPEGIEKLDWAVFSNCENLEEIVLPNSLKNIGEQLFLNCKKLKNVILPKNLEYIPNEFFKGCINLDIVLNEKITELGNQVFEDCHKLSNYPNNVINMGINCFRNCRSLENVIINENTQYLSDGVFDGCINLSNILHKGQKIKIGKKVFRNCKSLSEIPYFIENYNDRAFENCTGLSEIDIINDNIPFACFRGCKNIKTINNQNNIQNLGSFAFSNCESLEEINLCNSSEISSEAFSNCKNLLKVTLNNSTSKIGSRAFYNCKNLKDINLPDTISKIGKEAFKYCHSINSITIPANLKSFGDSAFSYMDSLEKIEVSPKNQTFITPDNKILIHKMHQKLMLYACGCKDKSYSLKDYNLELDMFDHIIVNPITGIHKYAFAGAKNLEELNLCCCTTDIEHTAFFDCPNLKTLKIHPIPFYTTFGFKLRVNNKYYFDEITNIKPQIPFENIEFCENPNIEDNFVLIDKNAFTKFNNITNVILPKKGNYFISSGAFTDCKKLKEIDIPNNVTSIDKDAFSFKTKLKFKNGLQTNNLIKLIYNNKYVRDYKLYVLNDDKFCIEYDYKIIELTKEYIDSICSHSDEIRDNPVLFIDFMEDLFENNLKIKYLFNGILFSNMSLENRKIFFKHFNKDDKFYLDVLKHSELLEKNDDVTKFLLSESNFKLVNNFITLLKKYNIKDKYIFKKSFMANSDNPLIENLIKVYDANTKRLLKESLILDNNSTSKQNLHDLIILMKITGALEDNPIIRQKASTFITEKIFAEKLPNGQNNKFRIVENDIHRIFSFENLRQEFDLEFSEFFLENYQSLIEEERKNSGFIERVYLNFREISRTSTSNKGSQRHLKVTIDKCKSFLSKIKFDGVNSKNKKLAELISTWYDSNTAWFDAQKIIKESLQAPRNIFTKVIIDEDGTYIYDNNPNNDLKENNSLDFSYEWLPKQDYDNLILGKYCNCCAHVEGAGQGIMRASMILDCCQNLVIRNNFGQIIAKSTIFVNKEKGYAVFNNVESSLNYRDEINLGKIYKAFLRGANAFMNIYNLNNKNNPITNISIGANRNTILDYLTDDKHPIIDIQKSLEYGSYSLNGSGYAGDWNYKQRLVLKK